MIIVCVYNTKKISFIDECIYSLKKYNKQEKILIVDNNSEDKSYIRRLEEKYLLDIKKGNLKILKNNHRDREVGAWWYAWKNFPNEEYYCFIHDSFILKKNIKPFIPKKESFSVFCFSSFTTQWERHKITPFGKNIIEKNSYITEDAKNNFLGVYGMMFNCRNNIMKILKENGVDLIIPRSRKEAMCCERIYGIIFKSLGIKINSLIKEDPLGSKDYGVFIKHRPGR